MPSNRAWIYVGLTATVAAVGLVELTRGPTLKKGDRVLLVGDSLAVGLQTPLGALAKEYGIAFQGIGIVGTRIDQWSQSDVLKQTLETFKPTVVLVSLGTNDAYMMAPPDVYDRQKPYLEQLLTLLESASPRAIVWIAPPTLPAAAVSLARVRALIASVHTLLRPRVAVFPSDRLKLARGPDGIHPVASGYAGWAGALWQWLT